VKIPMNKLIFLDPKFSGQVYDLVLDKTTVGRGDQNSLVIHDPSISATHCEILVSGPAVILHDLSSRNGTYVNGVRLERQPIRVEHRQLIRFGSVEARLEVEAVYDEGSPSEITAFHEHCRYVQAQDRLHQQADAMNPCKHLVANTDSMEEDHTVLLPKEVLAIPAPTHVSPTVLDLQGENRPRARSLFIAAAGTFCVVVMLWLIWLICR
jgi:predicted component of type VI protein secretion system